MSFNEVDSNKFNVSHLMHAGYALIISAVALLLVYFVPAKYVACFAGTLFFFAREHFHNELSLMNKKEGITFKVTLEALKIWKWKTDMLLDFLFPLIVSVLLCVGVYFINFN